MTDPDEQFHTFWLAYPRKVAKKAAERAWLRMKPAERESAVRALPDHVRYWRGTGIETQFIPHPATWLNQGRWDDELEGDHKVTAWWTTDEATLQYGKDRGMEPRPGESMAEYRRRLKAA